MSQVQINMEMNDIFSIVCCLKNTVDTIYQNWTAEEFATTDKFTNI